MKRARDSQRSRVYDWEITWQKDGRYGWDGDILTIGKARAFLNRVWSGEHGDAPPFLQDGRGVRRGYGGRWRINVPKRARTKALIIHEATHGLLYHTMFAWHGPEFVALYIRLLGRYVKGLNAASLRRSARAAGVKVASGSSKQGKDGSCLSSTMAS